MSELPYTLSQTRNGKIRVKYVCPKCKEKLESELFEAGDDDTCPTCQSPFKVPGVKKRAEVEAELKRRNAAKREEERLAAIEAEKARKQAAAEAALRAQNAAKIAAIEREEQEKLDEQNRIAAERKHANAADIALHTPENTTYPALNAYVSLMRVAGTAVLVAWVFVPSLFFLIGMYVTESPEAASSAVLMFILGAFVCLPLAFAFFVGSQLIRMAIDIRLDVAKLVQKRKA